jgi:hypothetical protein
MASELLVRLWSRISSRADEFFAEAVPSGEDDGRIGTALGVSAFLDRRAGAAFSFENSCGSRHYLVVLTCTLPIRP